MNAYTVRETNARLLANASVFWAGRVKNWPGQVKFCIAHITGICFQVSVPKMYFPTLIHSHRTMDVITHPCPNDGLDKTPFESMAWMSNDINIKQCILLSKAKFQLTHVCESGLRPVIGRRVPSTPYELPKEWTLYISLFSSKHLH